MDNIATINRKAWENECRNGNQWTIAVGHETIEAARRGKPHLLLTPEKEVPASWYQPISGKKVLCLASGGGQQTPQFAAMGAEVTVLDNSPTQLKRDADTAEAEGLNIKTELGDMRDLSRFPTASFDLIFHPVANCFIPSVLPVWRECHRVLKDDGVLLGGFTNPVLYCPDDDSLLCKHAIPYRDDDDLATLAKRLASGDTLEFSHTLEEQLGGLCSSGFAIVSLYTDGYTGDAFSEMVHDAFIAFRAVKQL